MWTRVAEEAQLNYSQLFFIIAMDVEPKPAGPSTDDSVAKCVKFFKTLITLTQQNQGKYAPDALETVRSLIEVCDCTTFWLNFLFSERDC
jgi:hypothetical protein